MPALLCCEPIANSIGKGQAVAHQDPIVDGRHHNLNGVLPDELNTNAPHTQGAKDKDFYDPRVNSFAYRDETVLTPRRKLKVFTIGAGIAGLILAHKIQHQYPEMQEIIEHTIFEALHVVGGTWWVNTYPGVQCDVPAHVYSFPFDPKPDWPNFYATGAQIHEYILQTTKKWNLDRDVKYQHKVLESIWQAERGQWKVTYQDAEGKRHTDHADVLIGAQGVLNAWKWPNIAGLDSFKGLKVHSAAWDHTQEYRNKRIAMIGNGSTGVQVLPQLAKEPGNHILSFQRSANWVYTHLSPSSLLGKDDPTLNPPFTEDEKRMFRENKEEHKKYRKTLIHNTNRAFPAFVKDSAANQMVTQRAREQMTQKLKGDPRLCAALIPDWPLGCRRITPADGYLESFHKPNVELITSPIASFTENGVLTEDGTHHPVDIVVCATGYATDWKPRWHMVGRNGADLRKEWDKDPVSYISVGAADMPNYFTVLGPNAVVAHGSIVEAMNWTSDYMIKWLRKMATEDIKSFCPKTKCVEDYVRYGSSIQSKMVWMAGCRSWFKRNTVDGRNVAAFPGSAIFFRWLISEIRGEDFDIEYRGDNMWWFFGNGFTDYELDDTNDLAWYVDR